MNIIVCPGIHQSELTESFILRLSDACCHWAANILVYPSQGFSSLSGCQILQFLHNRLEGRLESPVVFISFSAGVVGAIKAAYLWQLFGGYVKGFIAIDGWGVPLWGNFPIHRMSHDYFTHWSSKVLGNGENNFYAHPPVDHLEMWCNPQTVQGYWVDSPTNDLSSKNPLLATEFLHLILRRYAEN